MSPTILHLAGIRTKEVTFLMDKLRKILSALIILGSLASILSTVACNTIHGIGKDIERGGEATQDAADSVRRRF